MPRGSSYLPWGFICCIMRKILTSIKRWFITQRMNKTYKQIVLACSRNNKFEVNDVTSLVDVAMNFIYGKYYQERVNSNL